MAKLSRNPLAPVSYNVAKGVRKNSAIVRYVVKLDDKLSLQKREVVFERKVWLYSVTKASEYLVAQGVYAQGDFIAIVPALCILETRGSLSTDPQEMFGGKIITLEDARPWSNMTGGIKANDDFLLWNGLDYRIQKIEAMDFWNDDPAKFRLTLKGG